MKIAVLKLNKNKKILSKINSYKKQIFITIFLLTFSLLFVINSSKYISVTIDGILLYGTKILPTLLPFFFVTKILSNFNFIYAVCNQFSFLTKLLFNTKAISSYIFFMSIISGYPVGAKLTTEFYENKIIDKNDAQKILSFCSTSGPLFIIGTVGVGFFYNQFLGIIIFLIHVISSILNGIIYRNLGSRKIVKFSSKKGVKNDGKIDDNFNAKLDEKIDVKHDKNLCQNLDENLVKNNSNIIKNLNIENTKINDKNFSLQECMYSSIQSVLIVGGYIIIFYVLIQILLDYNILSPLINLLNLLGLPPIQSKGLCAGLIEITKGISILSTSSNIKLNFIISNFLISFSGVSILMQANAFLDKININKKLYVLQKFTHGVISLVLSIIVSLFIF